MLQKVKNKRSGKVLLTVYPVKLTGIKIYERLGFREEQFEQNYYIANTPKIIMAKILSYN
jgi:ribosomal protein S18 acetylase RimI-like enzyme